MSSLGGPTLKKTKKIVLDGWRDEKPFLSKNRKIKKFFICDCHKVVFGPRRANTKYSHVRTRPGKTSFKNYPPANEARKEVENLTFRKYLHTPVNVDNKFVCLFVCDEC